MHGETHINKKLSEPGCLVGVFGVDSGNERSIKQEKEGVGEGERLGEGMEIWGGDWGEWCRTGLIPLMEEGNAGAVGACCLVPLEEEVVCCTLLEETAEDCCCWLEGLVATTSCTSISGWRI